MTRLSETAAAFDRVPATSILVALSGGKDSICTLDVCVRRYGAANVQPFLMYLVEGLDCEWAPIRRLEALYGIKTIGVPHPSLSQYLKGCVLRPYVEGSEKIRLHKRADIEKYLAKKTGIEWSAWGERAADSIVRNAYLKRVQGVDVKANRLFPIWTWNKSDVFGYLRARKLPVPQQTGFAAMSGGVDLDPETLSYIRKHFPADFKKILAVFPLAEASVIRFEQTGKGAAFAAKGTGKAALPASKRVQA